MTTNHPPQMNLKGLFAGPNGQLHLPKQLPLALPTLVQAKLNNYASLAKQLKRKGEANFNSKEYLLSILQFLESMLLYIIDFKIKDAAPSSSTTASQQVKEKDWIALIKYSSKIIENFQNVEKFKQQNQRNNQPSSSNSPNNRAMIKNFQYCIGLLHYLNYFIIQHLIQNNQNRLHLLLSGPNSSSDDNNEEYNADSIPHNKLVSVSKRLLKLEKTARLYYRKGDTLLKNQEISTRFPKLQSKARKTFKEVKMNEFRLHEGNYYLPIVKENFNLLTMVNFSLHFLKIWVPDDYKYDWSI